MACVTFLRPFLESTASGGLATTIHSTKNSSARSTLGSLFSTRSRSDKTSRPVPSYSMDNLSEVGLNGSPGTTLGKSESNTNGSHTNVPSINNDEIHFVPASMNDHNDLGPLRPDRVVSISRVSNPPLEGNTDGSEEGMDMAITRTREWEVHAEHKHGKKGRSIVDAGGLVH